MDRSSGLWWGIVLIILGALFLAENLDIISIDVAIRDYWPVLLVLWGVWVLTRSDGPSRRAARRKDVLAGPASSPASAPLPPQGSPSGAANSVFGDLRERSTAEATAFTTVFGDLDIRVESPAFRRSSLSTVFGDCSFDLSRSTLADGEQLVKVSGVFGDAVIALPPGTAHALAAHTLFGGIDAGGEHRDGISSSLTYRSPNYEATSTKVRVEVSAVFGDIRVRG